MERLFIFFAILYISEASTHHYYILKNHPEKVKISIFYETFCPYSQRFIQKQLKPAHDVLSDHIDVDLVPYGKAQQTQTNDTWQFVCQHGHKECHGNKVQACANAKINENGPNKILNFISCTFDTNYTKLEIKNCSEMAEINFTQLERCYESSEGDEILAAHGVRTHSTKPPVKFVPMVFFDDVFDRDLNNQALDDLMDAICRLLKKEKPLACVEHDRLFLESVLNYL